MLLRPLITESTVLIDPSVRDKWELLGGMAAALYATRGDWELSLDELIRRVHDRERQLTTGLERGVALPHGLLPPGAPSLGALALLPGGLDFASLDGRPAHFILMLVYPDEPRGRNLHVELLARTVRLFTDEDLRGRLMGAADGSGVLRLLAEAEQRYFP